MTKDHSHVGKYMAVFGALLVLTAVTVGVSTFHMGIMAAVGVAMLVASMKGALVAAYFMHLIGEKKFIWIVLGITAFFFLLILAVPSLVLFDDYQIRTP